MITYTYDQLVTSLQKWRDDDNSEFVAAMPEFIGQGELRVLRELNLTLFDKTEIVKTTPGDRRVEKPPGWFMTRSIYRSLEDEVARSPMNPRTLDYCYGFAPDSGVQATPTQYADFSETHWYVVPTPNSFIYDLHCFVGIRPPMLSPSVQSNWLGNNVGDLLHHAAHLNALRFLKKWQEIPGLESLYAQTLEIARLELRSLIRRDYNPMLPNARSA